MGRVLIGNVRPSDEYLLERCAPAGYGYGGETMQYVYGSEKSLEDVLLEHIATMKNGSTKQITFACSDGTLNGKGRFMATIFRHESQYAYIYATTYRNYSVMKTLYNGEWAPFEWVNPPMELGVEYRTTERWQGKPVYACLVNVGPFPESGMRDGETNIVATGVIRFHASIGYTSFPIPGNMELYTFHNGEKIVLRMHTIGERVYTNDVYATLYYTKD